MKDGKGFNFAVYVLVAAVHIGGLWLLMGVAPSKLVIGASSMEVVLLGDLNLGQASVVAKPKQVSLPEPKPKPEKKLLTVKKPDAKADIVEQPKTKLESKPQPQPSQEVAGDAKIADRSAVGSDATSSGGGQAGGGQGDTVAMHEGGHLHNPKPPYPPLSLENNEVGSVGLRVVVEPDGWPSAVDLVKSSRYSRLDRSALKTVREQYRFIPATRMGRPVQSVYTFNIVFKIPER